MYGKEICYLGVSENDPTRYAIGDYDLHYGDQFKVKINGRWLDVTIELDEFNLWYLKSEKWGSISVPAFRVEAII